MNSTDIDSILNQAATETVQSLATSVRYSNQVEPGILAAHSHRLHVDRRLSGQLLPPNFRPTPYSVIVGRGKETKSNPGNKQLLGLATSYIGQYAEAKQKQTKTKIVSQIVAMVNNACPCGGGFIKRTKYGQWYEVDNSVARENVGYVFRDLLSNKYRSSSKSKLARNHQRSTSDESQTQRRNKTKKSKAQKEAAPSAEKPPSPERCNDSIVSLKSIFDMPIDTSFSGVSNVSSFQQSGVFELSNSQHQATESTPHNNFDQGEYDQLLNIPLLPFDE